MKSHTLEIRPDTTLGELVRLLEPKRKPSWSRAQIAAALGVSIRQLDFIRKQPGFPTRDADGKYLCDDISAWIDGQRFESSAQIEIETILYRYFDEDGLLLYVGVSVSPLQRNRQHKASSHWFNEVTRIELERFPTRNEALDSEKRAIQSEHPLHNAVFAVGAGTA